MERISITEEEPKMTDSIDDGGAEEITSTDSEVGSIDVQPAEVFMTQAQYRAMNKGRGVDHSMSAVAHGGYHGS